MLVLHGTAGFKILVNSGDLRGSAADVKVVEDIERILREIHSDLRAQQAHPVMKRMGTFIARYVEGRNNDKICQ
jgi:xyloglucan 6-xylosyltransferase